MSAPGRLWAFGAPKLHANVALREDFYAVVESCRGFIVDTWINDIAKTLEKHGYEMTVQRKTESTLSDANSCDVSPNHVKMDPALTKYRCTVCSTLWRLNPPSIVQREGSWSLYDDKQYPDACCDNSDDFFDRTKPVVPVGLWDPSFTPVLNQCDVNPTHVPLDSASTVVDYVQPLIFCRCRAGADQDLCLDKNRCKKAIAHVGQPR
jgi:hypothetical protein